VQTIWSLIQIMVFIAKVGNDAGAAALNLSLNLPGPGVNLADLPARMSYAFLWKRTFTRQ